MGVVLAVAPRRQHPAVKLKDGNRVIVPVEIRELGVPRGQELPPRVGVVRIEPLGVVVSSTKLVEGQITPTERQDPLVGQNYKVECRPGLSCPKHRRTAKAA